MVFISVLRLTSLALLRAVLSDITAIVEIKPIIPITTNNSIKVKPLFFLAEYFSMV